jgi:hypothetical protein
VRVISPPARAAARPAADAFYGGLSSLPVQQRSPLLLMALFGGYGVWWLLGIGAFVWPLFALLMALSLLRTPRVEVPPGSGLWVLFVLWTLASGVAISSSSDGLTFAFRVITYVSAGVIVLYVLNLPRRRDVTRSIVHALMAFWVVIVIGGYLGILVPHLSFPSVFERLLPGVVSRSGFLQQLVHPQLAQRQTWLRHARPSAPFPFSNMWGGTVGVLLPFVFLELRWARTTLRRVLIGALLVAAVLPIVRTADRGLWVSLGVAVAYVAIRRAVKGRVGLLVMLLLVAGIAGVALLADRSALAPVASQFDRSSSNEARQYLAQQSLTQALHHPWLGTGVPIRPPGRNIPYIGTQGQGWLVLVTSGFPALLLFLGWFGFAFWRSRRLDGELAFAAHVSLLVFFVHLPIYDMLPSELIVAMVACALVFRDPSSRLVRAVAVPRSPPPARPRLAGAPVGEPRRLAEPPDTPAGAAQRAGSFFVGARARPASDAERSGAATRLNTLARHSAMNLAGNVISAVLGFVLVLVVARGLGARGAGVFF